MGIGRNRSMPMYNGANVIGSRHPTLVGNTDPARMNYQPGLPGGGGNLQLMDISRRTARVPAIGTDTIGGTATENDVATLTIYGFSSSYTVQSGDDLTAIAAGLAAAVNANPDLFGVVVATSAAAVITITHAGGAAGALVPFTNSESAGATVTQTLSDTVLTGGSGPIKALRNFSFSHKVAQGSPTLVSFVEGKLYDVDAAMLAALVAHAMPIA